MNGAVFNSSMVGRFFTSWESDSVVDAVESSSLDDEEKRTCPQSCFALAALVPRGSTNASVVLTRGEFQESNKIAMAALAIPAVRDSRSRNQQVIVVL